MPYFVKVIGVRAPDAARFGDVSPGDDDHTSTTIEEALARALARDPSLEIDVLYEGSHDWFQLGVMRTRRGEVEHAACSLSLEPERFVDPEVTAAPEEEIELETLADGFVDTLAKVARDGEEADGDENFLTLPFAFEDPDATLDVLARVASRVEVTARSLVMVDDRPYRLTLSQADGAKLEPLHVWHDDQAIREWARALLPSPGAPREKRARAKKEEPTPADPARPLVTGSAQARLRAASELAHPTIVEQIGDMRVTRWSEKPAPGAFEKFAEAVRARENQDPQFAELRKSLYRYIPGAAPSPAVAAEVLESALHVETETMRADLYDILSRIDVPLAHRALVFGFKHDSDLPVKKIRQVIWRSMAALELLVRTELVPTWKSDGASSPFCKRVLAMIRSEFIPIPDEWLRDAPDDLRAALTRA